MGEVLRSKTAELFNEPGCAKNQAKSEKERKKGCSKPLVPGAAAGGCAFDGAKIALEPIVDVVHLTHGPSACEGNSWDNRHAATSGPSTYRLGLTTDLSELDIVMGNGEKRLYRAIKDAIARYDPPAVFVYQTCVPAMIGDDIEAVCRHAAEKTGTPCIPVLSAGFSGKKNFGNKLAGEALFKHVIGTIEPEYTTPTDVNILGEYNIVGEIWQIKPLLEKLGIRLLANITGDARYRDLAGAHRARVNMMMCSAALINLARQMEERWGIPYFEGSFYGIADTSAALRTLARMLIERGAPEDLLERTEALIAAEEARAWARIEPYREILKGKRVILYTGGVKSWSIVSALQEIGMKIVATSVRKSTEGDKERIKEIMDDPHMVGSVPAREMYAKLANDEADILLSGGKTQYVGLKARRPWLDINQERNYAYAGYDGTVALVAELAKSLSNPVWEEIRRPAPWEISADIVPLDCGPQSRSGVGEA
ncbi:nitrogenase iron-molybdenum cofactor biosynthesis protein NifE [Afifella marina]|uniref:Nitrogenase iron-molybdenum cofactor biosynthesis protein NifE n=1 Tax=Afifella marina DSM 2698 TaxID=1120955 RepID=A0A1G5N4Y3_AFIMA|nr:nitrogenase iron-molybdenum cofactor biosynthesis protein NifE [Afifella marina]MBK1622481.1 nitrogenase iron-molybdenum cofactor biosynthesis protein NifE [Afifella marina DSM 2698]MBK1626804.1 nitrogenase iron-molybdenum cofactor biosynthesis protein NifE [Afifella marina]MBK5919266.1 nitrogenase iron-molybdenum cofactor biosynthesis protein NifE [Afifella marina]RAI21306.1 nitrogenase iron-molybdenum cofactor biosynthesis protein NifE [Afifella marina DSM 2698]SCZ32402.1 nitrogenase moly